MSKQDKPAKRRHTSPVPKNPLLITRVLWAMLGLTLLGIIMRLFGSGGMAMLSSGVSVPLVILNALSALAAGAVLYKFLQPGWEPHRKWLGWLLGGALALKMTWFTLALTLMMLDSGELIIEGLGETGMAFYAAIIAVVIISAIFGLLVSPEFHLLRGLFRDTSTEKIAGALSVLAAVVNAVVLLANLFGGDGPGVMDSLSALLSLLISIGYVLVYYGWPVLSRAVGEE